MVKDIVTIAFNSLEVEKTTDNNNNNTLFRIDTPPIIIRNKGILKVSNFCHIGTGTGHTDNMYLFRIRGVIVDTSRFFTGNGGYPLILTTTFNNNRSLYDENIITLTKQTINAVEILVDTYRPSATYNNIDIKSGGTGYLAGQILRFTGGGSSDVISIKIDSVSSGAITSLSFVNTPTISYTSVPTLDTYINGSGASLTPMIAGGTIANFNILNGGSGYKVGQTIAIIPGSGGSGAVANISTVNALGSITAINISVAGSGYGTSPAPTASVNPSSQVQTAILAPNMTQIIKESIPNTLNFSITFIIEQDINE
jgi:hypothetical protein